MHDANFKEDDAQIMQLYLNAAQRTLSSLGQPLQNPLNSSCFRGFMKLFTLKMTKRHLQSGTLLEGVNRAFSAEFLNITAPACPAMQ